MRQSRGAESSWTKLVQPTHALISTHHHTFRTPPGKNARSACPCVQALALRPSRGARNPPSSRCCPSPRR